MVRYYHTSKQRRLLMTQLTETHEDFMLPLYGILPVRAKPSQKLWCAECNRNHYPDRQSRRTPDIKDKDWCDTCQERIPQ